MRICSFRKLVTFGFPQGGSMERTFLFFRLLAILPLPSLMPRFLRQTLDTLAQGPPTAHDASTLAGQG